MARHGIPTNLGKMSHSGSKLMGISGEISLISIDRMVILDGFEVSCIEGLTAGKTDEAKEFMLRHNPNDTNTFGIEWSKGLEGINKRFMPYNGKIGDQQMIWLKNTLTQCQSEGESVIILTHIPIHPSAADNLCLLWNYQVLLLLLWYIIHQFINFDTRKYWTS